MNFAFGKDSGNSEKTSFIQPRRNEDAYIYPNSTHHCVFTIQRFLFRVKIKQRLTKSKC